MCRRRQPDSRCRPQPEQPPHPPTSCLALQAHVLSLLLTTPSDSTMQLIRSSHKPETASKQPTQTFTGTVHMVPPPSLPCFAAPGPF